MEWLLAGAVLFAAVLLIEFGLKHLVHRMRAEFQWLITRADIAPSIEESVARKYMAGSFDPELGWVRKPGSSGVDETEQGPAAFAIDDRGARRSPGFDGASSRLAVFGDSYAFCRLVGDEQTWPHQLGQILGESVVNFGVGNYGLDQACLRMERELARARYDVVVMCIVPESMSRIHSYWKHYFEYGNVLAFKPRYTLERERLVHHATAVKTASDFQSYGSELEKIQALDEFYQGKFRKDILEFPYSLRILRRWKRHVPILYHLVAGRFWGRAENGKKRAFNVVLRNNAQETARLYAAAPARRLFAALAERFVKIAHDAGAEPLLIIVPQPVDLERRRRGRHDYDAFFERLSQTVPMIDFTRQFASVPSTGDLYVEGQLGPHVSKQGNQIIASAVAEKVRSMMPQANQKPAARQTGI